MALSELEATWRAWQRLNAHDRQQFLNKLEEARRTAGEWRSLIASSASSA